MASKRTNNLLSLAIKHKGKGNLSSASTSSIHLFHSPVSVSLTGVFYWNYTEGWTRAQLESWTFSHKRCLQFNKKAIWRQNEKIKLQCWSQVVLQFSMFPITDVFKFNECRSWKFLWSAEVVWNFKTEGALLCFGSLLARTGQMSIFASSAVQHQQIHRPNWSVLSNW